MYRLSFGSCRLFALIYAHIRLVVSGRDSCFGGQPSRSPIRRINLTRVSPSNRFDNAGDKLSGFCIWSVNVSYLTRITYVESGLPLGLLGFVLAVDIRVV